MQDFIDQTIKLQKYLLTKVYDDVGVIAVSHVKKAFQDEAYSDKSDKDMEWPEVKRRQGKGKGAAAIRKILTGGTGDLGRSIKYKKEGRKLLIVSDKVYAKVHNEGLEAGRKSARFTMPKRQFIGKSKILKEKIQEMLDLKFEEFYKL